MEPTVLVKSYVRLGSLSYSLPAFTSFPCHLTGIGLFRMFLQCFFANNKLTLKVLVATIDALGHFETA